MLKLLKNKLKRDFDFAELIKGSSTTFLMYLMGLFLSFIFMLIITRSLGAKAYGIFSLSFTLINIFVIVGSLGIGKALVRFISEYSSQNRWHLLNDTYNKSLKLVTFWGIFLSAFMFIFSPYISSFVFKKDYLRPFFHVASLGIIPLILLTINSESLRGLKRIKEYALLKHIFTKIMSIIALIFLITFFKNSYTPLISYILGLFISMLFSFILWFSYLKRNINPESKSFSEKKQYIDLLKVAFPMLLTTSLSSLLGWVDIIMLGIFKNEIDIGIYSVAMRLAVFTSITLSSINSIAAPKFAEMYGKKDVKGLEKIAKQSTKIIFWSAFPILFSFFVFPKTLLSFFGKDFASGAHVLMMVAFGQFISSICGSVTNILNMTGNQNIVKNIILFTTLVNVGLNYFLIPVYGINGAAFASMVSTIFWNIVMTFFIYKKFGFLTLYVPLKI